MSVSSRVQAGTEFLDEHYPGWASHIDPDTLNIRDGDKCVLGQIYNRMLKRKRPADYRSGFLHLLIEIGIENPVEFGFKGSDYREAYDIDCVKLSEEWKREIRARQANAQRVQYDLLTDDDHSVLEYETICSF